MLFFVLTKTLYEDLQDGVEITLGTPCWWPEERQTEVFQTLLDAIVI